MSYSVMHGLDGNKDPVAVKVDSSGRLELSPSSSFYAQVADPSALPPAGDHVGEIQIALASTGSRILFTFKDAGMYYSNGAIWKRLGDTPSYFLDSEFRVFNVSDNTRKASIDASKINTGTTLNLSIDKENVITVAKNGGDYKTIKGAIAIADGSTKTTGVDSSWHLYRRQPYTRQIQCNRYCCWWTEYSRDIGTKCKPKYV